MPSQALDLTTIAYALNELCDTYLGDTTQWTALTPEQQEFLTWYTTNREEILKLDNLKALASTNYQELNQFLTDNTFPPMFDPFNGIGVAAILDMLMHWVEEGHKTPLMRPTTNMQPTGKDIFGRPVYPEDPQWDEYPGFRLDNKSATIHHVPGRDDPLVQLHTKTGHSLWLTKNPEPADGAELNRQATQLAQTPHTPHPQWQVGAIIPMIELDLQPDLNWLTGMTGHTSRGEYHIESAIQRFKLRADEKGARIKVATAMIIACSAASTPPPPYVLNDPFIGYFTQPDHDTLPIAAFWADTDVWQQPAGSLEQL